MVTTIALGAAVLATAASCLVSCGKKEEPPPAPPAEAAETTAMRKLVAVCEGARSFVIWEKRAPKGIDEIVHEGYLEHEDTLDPWGKPFVMAVNDYGELEFYSDGPDGEPETDDDIEHFCERWDPPGEGGESDEDTGGDDGE